MKGRTRLSILILENPHENGIVLRRSTIVDPRLILTAPHSSIAQ